jgi:hypothetical protein
VLDIQNALEDLRTTFPDTTFFIATFPLTHSETTWKTWIKKIVNVENIWEYEDNVRVNNFNEVLRELYGSKPNFFDLAKIQSTRPSGEREVFTIKRRSYFQMVPAYTDDNVHLNEMGSGVVAEQFVLSLAGLFNTEDPDR